jgi:DNA damage-binding protein 1
MAFVGETRVLGMNADDELDEADIPGFDSAAQTLWCGNMLYDQIVQVTDKELRILNATTKQVVSKWSPPEGKSIVVVNGNASQVCVATNAGNVVLLKVENGSVVEVGHTTIDGEVSCLDLSPIGANTDSANLLTIGTWSMKIHLLSLPDLQLIGSHDLGGEVMPRSVLLATFEEKPYLLCGLGDGTLLSYHIEEGLLTNRKKLALGTKPITLREFK